jgi:GDP-L-fucose synthase
MSTCVSPDKASYPLNEKEIHLGEPHFSNFGYAYAKRMLDVQSRAYRKEYGSDFITVIPTNIYGPKDNFSIEDGHVLPSLIHKTFLAKKNNTELKVWGSGAPLREFVYAADIAKLALWSLDNYSEENPIIFSSGLEISIKDLVGIIVKKFGFEGKITFDATKPDGQLRKPSDTSKLKKYYPDFEWMSVEEGVDKTVDWFLANYPNIKQ